MATGRKRLYFSRTMIHISFIILSVFSLFPVLFMVVNSLKSKEEYMVNKYSIPNAIAWDNFRTIFLMKNYGRWFVNSFVITVFAVIITLAFAILTAYALSRYKFRLRSAITNFIISLIIVPPVVMIIPLFILWSKIDFLNTYHGLIIIYAGLLLPFSIYLLIGFFKTIPQSLIESAHIDGASSFRIIWRIVFPLSMPAIGTLFVVNSIWVWNELLIALVFMQKENMRTIIGGLSQFVTKFQVEIPLLMMGLTIATLPIVVLYLFTQQYFVRGLTAGALKE